MLAVAGGGRFDGGGRVGPRRRARPGKVDLGGWIGKFDPVFELPMHMVNMNTAGSSKLILTPSVHAVASKTEFPKISSVLQLAARFDKNVSFRCL